MMKNVGALMTGALLLAVSTSQANAVTIIPTFDSSITTNSEAGQIETAIDQVTSYYSAFSNDADVRIYFELTSLGGPGGESLTSLYSSPYAYYTGLLAADAANHPENMVLNTAVANFAYGNQAPNILFTSADYQALATPGVNEGGIVIGGNSYDGVVALDTGIGAYNFGSVVPSNQVSGLNVLYHEVDEVLGAGGAGSWVGRTNPGNAYMGAEDLYRYDGVHSPSFTTNPSDNAYFSYNGGVTDVRGFNQNGQGDYADWARVSCSSFYSVQSWADCYGDQPVPLTRTSDEVQVLQALGYNLAGVPEPSSWAMLLFGLGLIGSALRIGRRGAKAAAAAA